MRALTATCLDFGEKYESGRNTLVARDSREYMYPSFVSAKLRTTREPRASKTVKVAVVLIMQYSNAMKRVSETSFCLFV